MSEIHEILAELGITQNYRGYRFILVAVQLALEDENRLNAVMREIYAETALRCNCRSFSVERCIRTVIARAWQNNPKKFCEVARYTLQDELTVSEFIAILAGYIQRRYELTRW